MDHRGHDFAPTPTPDDRRADLAAMFAGPNYTPPLAVLEAMVYGPRPLTDASRAVIAEWCES